jgi:hypothetical protein
VPEGDALALVAAALMPAGFSRACFDPNFPRPITTCAHFARVPFTTTAARTEATP